MHHGKIKRIISVLLSACLCFGMTAIPVAADSSEGAESTVSGASSSQASSEKPSGGDSAPEASSNPAESGDQAVTSREAVTRLPLPSREQPQKPEQESSVPSLHEGWSQENASSLRMACDWLTNSGNGSLYFLCMGSAGIPAPTQMVNSYIAQMAIDLEGMTMQQLSKAILNTTFSGYHAANFLGTDLLGRVDGGRIKGAENAAWMLLALDSNQYDLAEEKRSIRKGLVELIRKSQNPDGGFADNAGEESSPAVTALVLTALSEHRAETGIEAGVQRGVDYLAAVQAVDGSYSGRQGESSAVLSKVIVALSALGIADGDPRFVKQGDHLEEVLYRYAKTDGGFSNRPGDPSDVTATEFAVLAMVSMRNQGSPYLLATELVIDETVLQQHREMEREANQNYVISLVVLILLSFAFIGLFLFAARRQKRKNEHAVGFPDDVQGTELPDSETDAQAQEVTQPADGNEPAASETNPLRVPEKEGLEETDCSDSDAGEGRPEESRIPDDSGPYPEGAETGLPEPDTESEKTDGD